MAMAFRFSIPARNHGSLHGGTSHVQSGGSKLSSPHRYSIVDANIASKRSLSNGKAFLTVALSLRRRKSSTKSIKGISQFFGSCCILIFVSEMVLIFKEFLEKELCYRLNLPFRIILFNDVKNFLGGSKPQLLYQKNDIIFIRCINP